MVRLIEHGVFIDKFYNVISGMDNTEIVENGRKKPWLIRSWKNIITVVTWSSLSLNLTAWCLRITTM